MIRIENLTKIHLTDELETSALAGVDLTIEAGQFLSIMGPSGSGKSTLLNILGLLDMPSDGRYIFQDRDVTRLSERQRTDLRRDHMGFVFQAFNLIDELTVEENVELPLLYHKLTTGERAKRVDELLAKVGMDHRKGHFPNQLSGGQQQRVAVARAVTTKPQLILADEPTGNLDSSHGDEVMGLLEDLHHDGATVVMVTHSPECAARGDATIEILDGKITKA